LAEHGIHVVIRNGKSSAPGKTVSALRCACRKATPGGYSVFDSALNRMQNAEWQFPQEIATLHATSNVNK